jgi:hypothetical protein
MAVIVVGKEKSITALKSRIFVEKVSAAAVRETTEAIAAANPHVDLKKLEPGTILTIPDSPHVSVKGDVSLDDQTKELFEAMANEGGSSLERLIAAAKTSENEAAAERKELAKTLSNKDLDTAARKDQQLLADVKSAQDAVAAGDANAGERIAALDEASTEWTGELEKFKELFGT